MGRAATSLSKLADTAREELPSTMAAIRLSGMEISDLTLELSDLSQEIADRVSKSTQAVQVAEAGIRQIGAVARLQTICVFRGVARNNYLGGPGCNIDILNIILKSIGYKIINFHISSYT